MFDTLIKLGKECFFTNNYMIVPIVTNSVYCLT